MTSLLIFLDFYFVVRLIPISDGGAKVFDRQAGHHGLTNPETISLRKRKLKPQMEEVLSFKNSFPLV
jgi:hypothetical protein